MPKDTKQQQQQQQDNWLTYEALLQDVYFEYPNPFQDEPIEEVEKACKHYLDTWTNGYRMEKFYLKGKKKDSGL